MLPLVQRIREVLRRHVTARTRTGPYRFLIRQWNDISDIELASRVLDTQFFDKALVPQALSIEELGSILVLAPHQDDETIGAGGTLLLAKRAGVDIDVLFVTDGRPSKPLSYGGRTPEEVVDLRNREAEEVCSILGAQIHHLSINNAKPLPTVDDLDRLCGIIEGLAPQVLVVPWLLDRPNHRFVNHLLWLAHQRHPFPGCEVWGYQIHNTLLPNGYVDITDVAEEKRKLLECYTSQNQYYKRYDHMTMGMAAWNCRFLPNYKGDRVARYVEIFCALPLREHLKLVESFYFTDLAATYRGNDRLEGMTRIHQEVVGKPPR